MRQGVARRQPSGQSNLNLRDEKLVLGYDILDTVLSVFVEMRDYGRMRFNNEGQSRCSCTSIRSHVEGGYPSITTLFHELSTRLLPVLPPPRRRREAKTEGGRAGVGTEAPHCDLQA